MHTLFSPSSFPMLVTSGLLSFLLLASFLLLPQLQRTLGPISQRSSADRPESPLLTPITSNPAVTLSIDLLPVLIVSYWWGRVLASTGAKAACNSSLVRPVTIFC